MEQLCKRLKHTLDIAAITNDIYTVEAGALPAERVMGVERFDVPASAPAAWGA